MVLTPEPRFRHRPPEEMVISPDGNTMTRASAVGDCGQSRSLVQPMSSTEDDSVGFSTNEQIPAALGHRSTGPGKRYHIDGDPRIYNGPRRTAHVDYVMVRK